MISIRSVCRSAHPEFSWSRSSIVRQLRGAHLANLVRGGTVAAFENHDGRRCVVHRSVQPGYDWQLSTICADGLPCGHSCPPTFQEGCLRACSLGEVYWSEFTFSRCKLVWVDTWGSPAPF